MGLHHAVALCMEHCHTAELTGDDAWFKTIVLSGGTACLPGLAGRICIFSRFHSYCFNFENCWM